MSVREAIKGAQAELSRTHSALEKARRFYSYAKIISAEIFGTIFAVPYGVRAFALHHSLPEAATLQQQRNRNSVSIIRDDRYGKKARNVMDIYLPPNTHPDPMTLGPSSSDELSVPGPGGASGKNVYSTALEAEHATKCVEQGGPGAPMVLFCHGGVWATGAKWHYSPMATRLAQAGVITAVMQYSLYPEVLIPHMVAEVSRALSWTLDHGARLGGDPSRLTLVGHSSGAHTCAMALLHRAILGGRDQRSRRLQERESRKGKGGGQGGIADAGAPQVATAAAPTDGSPAMHAGQMQDSAAELLQASATARRRSREEKQQEGGQHAEAPGDARMPATFVGVSGVYDLAKHYQYEEGRGLHVLSTMARACGGVEGFPSLSPSVILGAALERERCLPSTYRSSPATQANREELVGSAGPQAQQTGVPSADRPSGADSAAVSISADVWGARFRALRGEGIARRIGFNRQGVHAEVGRTAGSAGGSEFGDIPFSQASSAQDSEAQSAAQCEAGVRSAEQAGILSLTTAEARGLPPTILMSTLPDVVVPWYESSEMYWRLQDCGVPVKHLVYDKGEHSDFVTDWRPLVTFDGRVHQEVEDLHSSAADLVQIASWKSGSALE